MKDYGTCAGRDSLVKEPTIRFMFETRFPQHVTKYAADLPTLQAGYPNVWEGLRRHFDPNRPIWNGD